ncbi:MAG: SpoIIE family protein phosphatase [Bacteroidales bacterium]|nr:SpoIIE family protein phosphatase [Bacteroidales bacterium]
MKKGLHLVLFLLFFSLSVNSQVNRYGTPLVSLIDAAETPGELGNLCVTMDGRGVIYFGNDGGGILSFDGSSWNLIPASGTGRVTALATDTRGIVFAGSDKDLGLLQPDESGRIIYCSLSERISNSSAVAEIMTISSIAVDSNGVSFTDGKRLYRLAMGADSVSVIDLQNEYGLGSANKLVVTGNRLFIADDREGLFEYMDGRVVRIPGGEKAGNTLFVKLLPYDTDNLLIAASGKGLMLFNFRTGTLTEDFVGKKANGLLQRGTMNDLVILPGNLFAAGMGKNGGVYIFSHEGKLLQHISDRTTSIRESSVTAMYCDHMSNSQLWFCTRGFINRAYVSLPAGEFGSAAGVSSPAGPIITFADSAFVGTDDGLYKNYSDRSGIMRFRRIRNRGSAVNDLITTDFYFGSVLLAATSNGLLQIESDGDATRFFSNMNFTVVRPAMEDSSLLVAGSVEGEIWTLRYNDYEWELTNAIGGHVTGAITDIEQSTPGEWWLVTAAKSSLIRMHCESNDTTFINYGREQGICCDTIRSIAVIDDVLYLCTGKGIYHYNRQSDTFEKDHDLAGNTFDNVQVNNLFQTPEGEIILSGYDIRNFDALVTSTRLGHVVFRRQFDFLPDIATRGVAYIDGSVWLAKGNSIFVLDKTKLAFRYGECRTFFTRITAGSTTPLMDGTFFTTTAEGFRAPSVIQPETPRVRLKHRDNDISFHWTTTSCVGERKREYRWKLEGFDRDWSGWEGRNWRDYTNLPSGNYVFLLKSRNITGLESEDLRYSFTVWKPWYASFVARLLYVALAGWLIYSLIRYYARRLNVRNKKLESLLKQRNEAKERGGQEMERLEKYAGIIQRAMQPADEQLGEAFPNSFVLHRPKETVSGDFFWVKHVGKRTFIAVGDCTGHGIPSSLRTVMAQSFLSEIVTRSPALSTSEILREFRNKLSETFKSLPESEVQREGIDISMLTIDRSGKTVEYSGAASQCFRIREMSDQEVSRWERGEFNPNEGTLVSGKYLLETVYGDRIPLGMHLETDHAFTQHRWKLERESSYYLFTDGYADQFNGITGKKFLKKNMRKLILDIREYPMGKQREILTERLDSWMGQSPQTDDILVAGLRIE